MSTITGDVTFTIDVNISSGGGAAIQQVTDEMEDIWDAILAIKDVGVLQCADRFAFHRAMRIRTRPASSLSEETTGRSIDSPGPSIDGSTPRDSPITVKGGICWKGEERPSSFVRRTLSWPGTSKSGGK